MKLATQTRTVIGKKGKLLRKAGLVPGIIYGRHLATPLIVSFDKVQLVKAIHAAGRSTPVELDGDGVDQLILFHDIQLDPVTDHVIHVDCLAVKKDEKVRALVPVIMFGISPFEKNNLGRVQLIKAQLEVEAFPLDLPHDIQIDISVLENAGDVFHVSDIKISDKIVIIDNLDDAVLSAVEFKEEVEEVAVVAEVAVEGAAGAEGAKPGEAPKPGEAAKSGEAAKGGDAK